MAPTGQAPLRVLWRLAGALLTVAALGIGLCVLIPAVLGFQRYVITSGSMTGTYDRGSLVFDRVVPTSRLRPGDVITFRPPGQVGLVTHRIISLRTVRGQRVLRTKGDANRVPDAWGAFILHDTRQARVAFHIPYAGFPIAALSDRRLRMAIIGGPAAFIALVTLAGLWRTTDPEVGAARP
jgi:signal peptidase I